MRINLGALQMTPDGYPVVSEVDPSVTYKSCLPSMCGQPASDADKFRCSMAGYVGVKSCGDANCAPWCPNRQIDQIVKLPQLTPQTIVQPLPDITRSLQPAVTSSNCGGDMMPDGGESNWWCDLNRTIATHPVAALAVLGATFVVVLCARSAR